MLSSSLAADTIRLKDGTLLTGKVTSQDPSVIVLFTEGKETTIAKADIALFREDGYGTKSYRDMIAAREEARAKELKDIESRLGEVRAISPTGLWLGASYGEGYLATPQEAALVGDRATLNLVPRGGQAAAYFPLHGHSAKGGDAHIRFDADRFYVEAIGFSYEARGSISAIGLPPVTAAFNPGSTTFNQWWTIGVFARHQNASGSFGIEPYRFSTRLRAFLFAGKSGFNTMTVADGPLFSSATILPSLYFTALVQRFKTRLSGSGPRGGLELRFQAFTRLEFRASAAAASYAGITKDRGTLVIGPSTIPGVSGGSLIMQHGSLWVRKYDYSLGGYFAVNSRLRVFVIGSDEESRIIFRNRMPQNYLRDLNLSNYYSQDGFGEFLLRYYGRPTYTGRFRRITAGAEFRI